MRDSKLATSYSQGTHNSVSQGRWMPCEETKNPNMKLLNGASDWKISADLKTSLQSPVHIIQTEMQPDIVTWSDSKKSVLLIELTIPWEENQEEAHKQNKNRYETSCRLHGIGSDMLCDSYWGWLSWFSRTLSHFVSFKNRNHRPQFESCLLSSSEHGAICIKLDLVKSEKSSAWMKCMQNHHSCVIT